MATFTRRKRKDGVRYTARVRLNGRKATKTFSTLGNAKAWARSQETAIETGEYVAPMGTGLVFADLIDQFVEHRIATRRPLGKTATNVLLRLKEEHGLESPSNLTDDFWYAHALKRIRDGVSSQTAVGDLAYVASVLAKAKRDKKIRDADGPAEARVRLAEEGLRMTSRRRERRIKDEELDALLDACGKVRSSVPMYDIVRFALATSMRRGEILRLRWSDLDETERTILVRNRKHPRDRERVDEVPLMQPHPIWPRWDPIEIIKAQPRAERAELIFPFQDDTVGERWEHICEAAGVTDVVFHLLRHESLSRYAERGFDPLRLQLIGGHRDIRHVVRYARLTARGLAREVGPGPAGPDKAAERADEDRAPA